MSMSSGLRFHESTTDPTSDLALTDGGEIIDGRPPIVAYAMKESLVTGSSSQAATLIPITDHLLRRPVPVINHRSSSFSPTSSIRFGYVSTGTYRYKLILCFGADIDK